MSNFKKIDDDIFIGPQPTAQDLQEAKQQGIKTVIDFRMQAETATSNEMLTKIAGLGYASIPVNKADLSSAQIGQLERVVNSQEGPFLLHCATGARAALLFSLNQARQHGWSAEQLFKEAEKIGFDLKTSPEFSNFVTKTLE